MPPRRPDKIDFKTNTVRREKEGHYIIIKRTIQKEDKTINFYAPSMGASRYRKQLIKNINEMINSNTIIVGTLTPHLHQWIDHPKRKQETVVFNDTLEKMDLTDIVRTFHPETAEYIFFFKYT